MSNKDEATREALASELGELKDKYSRLEESFTELKKQASLNENQGLVQSSVGKQPPPGQQNNLKNTFHKESDLEATSELGHS